MGIGVSLWFKLYCYVFLIPKNTVKARGLDVAIAVLELKKISKSPFGNYRRKNGRQMQKCSRQIVEEQKLKLGPHLIGVVFGLPVDCFRGCGTDRNTRYGRT